ncbi:3-dehydroquinate synthase [Rhodocytophaga rosea]|uniref:3-dehydroquinate synthase n=1 Tax=Rhodocytophaga rosea TaxID=2704465 RepID=A0A6C0GDS9_9BACT|nr:3-dehydroquinate synthase [Rhodocytophaga rosea]QHT66121.1 3-dehydroquinate synthase [Rhodocytophaga rosea]
MNLGSVRIAPAAGELVTAFFEQHTYTNIAVLVDEHTKKYCYPLIKPLLPKHLLISIKSGEEKKNLETCSHIWQQLTDKQFDRKSLVINLGGGVIGDMGGFCASTYKRGIDFIQAPTTLLAQVDASVGGKLGIDFNGFKNHIGVFKEPVAVLIATDFLKTLPWQEVRSGFAEIIKHCLITDAAMWQKIRKRDLDKQKWEELVPHSVQIKQEVVRQDPTEKGLRKILNFGHTIGHAVESYFLAQTRKKLLHGEAIAVGMICEAFISMQKGLLTEDELIAIEEFIFAVYGKVKITDADIAAILPLTLQDKKNEKGKIQCVLLEKPGKAVFDQIVTFKDMQEALDYYKN